MEDEAVPVDHPREPYLDSSGEDLEMLLGEIEKDIADLDRAINQRISRLIPNFYGVMAHNYRVKMGVQDEISRRLRFYDQRLPKDPYGCS